MIDFKLIRMAQESLRYVLLQVLWQWLGLLTQIGFAMCISMTISSLQLRTVSIKHLLIYLAVASGCILLKLIFDRLYLTASLRAGIDVKRVMRNQLYNKLLVLGNLQHKEMTATAITQLMGEGVEQLELYFGKYLGQFAYAILAPVTLFIFLRGKSGRVALALLLCSVIIIVVMALITQLAKGQLGDYLEQYHQLGSSFLEKFSGMRTLKYYHSDEQASEEIQEEAEDFRTMAMKVLFTQLNSSLLMNWVVYGGTAFGIILTISELTAKNIELDGAVILLILASEFFLPMRTLGSFFNYGLKDIKTAGRIHEILEMPEHKEGKVVLEKGPVEIYFKNVSFAYNKGKQAINDLFFEVQPGKTLAIVGMSGSGKSTIAKLLTMQLKGYQGSIRFNKNELSFISQESLLKGVTLVPKDSYIFPGTVRDNLLLGNTKLEDKKLIAALTLVNLWPEIKDDEGLDFEVSEDGNNLTGSQCQRLVFARALLKNSSIYILDEATSKIDKKTEAILMSAVKKLAREKGKTVIIISHRLSNVVDCDDIILLGDGTILEHGNHRDLLRKNHGYAKLYRAQMSLDNIKGGES
ncbi:MAG: ATP-binding cassette domain-containing protein [Pseudobutyrivibrio sp.]|nr:ATP-binding cassette domain-containing protein [Pseudobutyrivibrio sp.]